MRIKHKFKAHRTEVGGIKFDSKKEANYYRELLIRKRPGGDVLFFLRQVPFHLPGSVVFRCDFQVFYRDGHVAFQDVKGYRTPQYIMKKKQVESLYPVTIEEI